MKNISQQARKLLSLVLTLTLLLATVSVSAFSLAAEEAEQSDAPTVYAHSISPTGAISVNSPDGGALESTEYGGYYLGSGKSGTLTFTTSNFAPITDYKLVMLIHNPSIGNSVTVEASSDGVTFTGITPTVKKTGDFANTAWDCGYYDVFGSFDASENIRFIRVALRHTLATANGIISFNYNAADFELLYCNTLDIPGGTIVPLDPSLQGVTVGAGGRGGYMLWQGTTPVSGDLVYSLPDGISNFLIHAVEFMGTVEYFASVDGVDWTKLSVVKTLVQQGFGGDGGLQLMAHSGVLLPEAGYKHLKIRFNNSGNGVVPVVVDAKYNNAAQIGASRVDVADPEMANAYDVTMTPHQATANSEGTLKSNADGGFGGWIDCDKFLYFSDSANNWKPGTLDFYSEKAITKYRFKVFDNSSAGDVNVYASVDGQTWLPVSKKVAVAGDSPNPAWGDMAPYYVYGGFKENTDIHYVRLELATASWLGKFPAIYSFEYSNNAVPVVVPDDPSVENAPMADAFEFTMTASQATGTSAGVLKSCVDGGFGGWTDCDKFCYFAGAGNAWQPGVLDFYSEEAITAYRLKVFDDSHASHLKVYASVDGQAWAPLDAAQMAVAGASPNPDWGDVGPQYVYGTFQENSDIHFIRVQLVAALWFGTLPAVDKLEYNTVSTVLIETTPTIQDRYEHRIDPSNATTTHGEYPLTNMHGVGDNLTYPVYTFWDMEEWTGGDMFNAWKPGSMDFYSETAISHYRIKGIWSGVDGDIINVYASVDGTEWKKLTPKQAEVGDFSNPNWGAFTSKWYYGSFKEDTDIHYIRIEMVQKVVWLPFLPGICFIDYNTVTYTGKPARPDNYVNTSVESNYFLQDDQFITFKSGSSTTDYDLWLKPIDGQTPKIYLSLNNNEWSDSAAVSEEVGDGVFSYYDALRADDGVVYIKVDKTTAEFVQLRYNIAGGGADTERRHYEMPEIIEDIEDLELDSVRTPFKEYSTLGVVEFYDMSITGNGGNASFIGGEYGLLGHNHVSSTLMDTPNVRDFKVVAAFGMSDIFSHIKAYGRTSVNGEETEIPLMRAKTADFAEHGFANYVFRPANREALEEAGYHFIRFELAQEYIFMQQVLDFVYFYELPELVPMPDFRKPDASKGEIELMDVFDSAQLTTADDGKAEIALQLHKDDVAIGRNNPADRVIIKDYYMAESFIVYKVPDLTYFDIRVYKSAECNTDLVISLSADGETWKPITVEPLERDIHDGWRKAAYQASDIESGMHYVKIEIPDLDGVETDLMISDIQMLHTGTVVPEIPKDDEEEPGDEPVVEETPEEETPEEETPEEDVKEEDKEDDKKEEEEEKKGNKKKVVKVKKTKVVGLYWWQWTLIGVGVVAVIGAGLAVFFILRAKKRKAIAADKPQA